MGRRLILVAALFALLAGRASAATFTKQEVTVPMSDGAQIAATLYTPTGVAPAAGWPAVMMFHGLGGKRQDMNTLAEQSFANEGFAVFTFDMRGHAESGGLFDADGPRMVADFRELFGWLAAQPGVDAKHIGAWGISLGGGAVWRSLVEGVPFAACETVETWTDLYQALIPQGLAKSGLIYGFLASVPADRTDPGLLAIKDDAFASRNLPALRAFGELRSSRASLGRITTPCEIFQGRRDYAFGLEQGIELYKGLAGPKRLYIGAFGHPPSTFPGDDIAVVMAEGGDWFSRFLKGTPNGIDTRPPVELAPQPWHEAGNVQYAGLPATTTGRVSARFSRTLTSSTTAAFSWRTTGKLEVFGAPEVRVPTTFAGGWSQLVATLTARTPGGETFVVGQGGIPTVSGKQTSRILLSSFATYLPRGTKLTLSLGTHSVGTGANALIYPERPMPPGARASLGAAVLTLPVLRRPISG